MPTRSMVADSLTRSRTTSLVGQLLSSPWALQELSCSAIGLADISIGGKDIIDEDNSCIIL